MQPKKVAPKVFCCFLSNRLPFLILAHYVPNVVKRREVYEISVILKTNRPTDHCSWKSLRGRTLNGHISITVLDRCIVTMDHP